MITAIVSGGQTGADQAGWRAAKRLGLKTAGYMPQGYRTEAGAMPHFAQGYHAVACDTPDYKTRTELNVDISTGTVIFGNHSPGSDLTKQCCLDAGKPWLWLKEYQSANAHACFRLWAERNHITILNVAGNRESKARGIGLAVERFLVEVIPTCR